MARTLTICDDCRAQVDDPQAHAAWHAQLRQVDPAFLQGTPKSRLFPPDPPELVEAQRALDKAHAAELAARAKWSPAAAKLQRLQAEITDRYKYNPRGFSAMSKQEKRELDAATDEARRLFEVYRAAAERTAAARIAAAEAQRVAMLAAIEGWKEPVA